MFRPDFIHTDEDWVIWRLGSEFHEHASPKLIIERTHLNFVQVEEILMNLERLKAVRGVRIPGRFSPNNIATVGLQKFGSSMYEDLKNGRDVHDVLLFPLFSSMPVMLQIISRANSSASSS